MHHKASWPLTKSANRGFGGYPVATIAFYGFDDRRASKVAVGIVPAEGAEAADITRWFSDGSDLRDDVAVESAISTFIEAHRAKTVVMADRIIGCPHEEGTDDPSGQKCPACRFWATRDRWTGDVLQ